MTIPAERASWRPWSPEGLGLIWALAGAGHSLHQMADCTGRHWQDCNLALDALIGRSPASAAAQLNKTRFGPVEAADGGGRVTRFLNRMFGHD